ncbi:MAG: hypothetical protein ABI949_17190 [Ilumatobacteraceae bacterium]
MSEQEPAPRSDFDFWVGDWAVHLRDTNELIGHNRIQRTQLGHVLVENYTTVSGRFSGTSLNGYDHVAGRWHQCWMDMTGLVLDLYGNLVDGAMVMSSGVRDDRIERISWTPDPDGSVRQHWQQSTDHGATWVTVFDGTYRRQ